MRCMAETGSRALEVIVWLAVPGDPDISWMTDRFKLHSIWMEGVDLFLEQTSASSAGRSDEDTG